MRLQKNKTAFGCVAFLAALAVVLTFPGKIIAQQPPAAGMAAASLLPSDEGD